MSLRVAALLLPLLSLAACAADAEPGENEQIGRVAQAITNSDPDTSDDAVVALLVDGEVFCTGTLIANDTVLTAAHCVTPEAPDQVYFGQDPSVTPAGSLIAVAEVSAHPSYDEGDLANDIAVVRLKTASPVPPKARLSPSTLSDPDFSALPLRIVGFGATAATDTFKALKREGTTKVSSLSTSSFKFAPSPSQTCNGDSGGPAFATVNGAEVLVGVTSAGDTNCNSYGRDMRVDAYEDFIDGKMKEYSAALAAGQGDKGSSCSASPTKVKARSGVAFALLALAFVVRRRGTAAA